jgi:hypothetical protein
VAEEVPVTADGAGKGPDMDDLSFDVCNLSHRTGGAGANDNPRALADSGRVLRLVDESPREARVVLRVEIELKVDGGPAH